MWLNSGIEREPAVN